MVDFRRPGHICACMGVSTQLELCLHEQTQIVANAVCGVGSQHLLAR